MKETPFDKVANLYDTTFTNTLVGRAQRDIVWRYLEQQLPQKPVKILELNCGTGEDAVWLSKHGHHVTATDVSAKMIDVTREKARNAGVELDTLIWDLTTPFEGNDTYDIIFSNFGGLNCLSPEQMHTLKAELHRITKPNGMCIFVIMGNFCLMESIYFLTTFRFKSAFRRRRSVEARLSENNVIQTWYYSPSDISNTLRDNWQRMRVEPVGVVIPPSFLNPGCERHPKIFSAIKKLDRNISISSITSVLADHYCISFKKK